MIIGKYSIDIYKDRFEIYEENHKKFMIYKDADNMYIGFMGLYNSNYNVKLEIYQKKISIHNRLHFDRYSEAMKLIDILIKNGFLNDGEIR